MHEKHILQVDVGAHNIVLDKHDNLKFCTFAGSSIDGGPCSVVLSAHASKRGIDFQPSVKNELFALGSLLFEIETTYQAYHDKEVHEIEDLFCASAFPDTHALMLGLVIHKCWRGRFANVAEALADTKRIQEESGLQNRVIEEENSGSFHPFGASVICPGASAWEN